MKLRIDPVILNQLLRVLQPSVSSEETYFMSVKKQDSFVLPDCFDEKNFNDPNVTRMGPWMQQGLDSIKFQMSKDRTEELEETKPF